MAASNSDDPAWILFILLLIFIFVGWLVWYLFRVEILDILRYVRMAELAPIMLFDEKAAACFSWLRQAPIGNEVPPDATIVAAAHCFGAEPLRRMTPQEAMQYFTLTPQSLGQAGRVAMNYWRWVALLFCSWLVYRALFICKKDAFKTRYNLESFIQRQATMWPVIKPISSFNPSKHSARIPGSVVPAKLPLFAEALSPEEWVSFHQIPVTGGVPDKEKTRQAFLAQLGPRWNGSTKEMPLYMQGLWAAFALKGAQKRDESDDLLGRLSLCWSEEKGFRPSAELVAEVRKILQDPEVGGKALEIANKYAYRTTAILGILRWARFMGGVLAAAQFLWLRGTDRTLWYALNNLGRRSFHMEGAGAMAHYMAEENAQKALPMPRLETAIVALNQYFAANQPVIPPFKGEDRRPRAIT